MNKHVILLHGLWESKRLLSPISKRLMKKGYVTHKIDYNTTSINLNDLFSEIDSIVLNIPDGDQINFIGHSLGGVMIRTYFDNGGDIPNSKVITLGSPHQSSHAAKFIKRIGLSRIFGNASEFGLINQICSDSWVHDAPLGNIAGNNAKGIIQLLPQNLFREHDGMVLVSETHLEGQTDHITIYCSHIDMLYKKSAHAQIDRFLEDTRFIKEEGE